ncbi:hypothetical protein ACJ8L8_09205, partial [Bifidobacterium bifidum]
GTRPLRTCPTHRCQSMSNRTKRYRKAATRYDRLDEAFLADLRLILIATYLKKTQPKTQLA